MFALSQGKSATPHRLLPFLFLTAAAHAMSTTTKPAALIFLHGLGDTPAGWSSLQKQLPSLQPSLSKLNYIFPAAPMIPLTINGGMTMPGWFDLYDWPIGVGVKNDSKGLQAAVDVVEKHVQELEAKGVERERIVIGGFSQGGAVALRAVYNAQQEKSKFAGCVSLSGWVTFEEVVDNGKDVPLFLAHGSYDDKVLFEQQKHAEMKLAEGGVGKVESKTYSMGHSSHPNEMADMAKFLNDLLFKDA